MCMQRRKNWFSETTHTHPPQWGWLMRCGSCTSLWDCVQNKCTRRRPQKWYSIAGWRGHFPHFSRQTVPALDIWRHLGPRPLTLSSSYTPESSRKLSRSRKDKGFRQKISQFLPSGCCRCYWTASWSKGFWCQCSWSRCRVTSRCCRSLPSDSWSSLQTSQGHESTTNLKREEQWRENTIKAWFL